MFVAVCFVYSCLFFSPVLQTKVFALLACLFVDTVGCLRSGCMFTGSREQQMGYWVY